MIDLALIVALLLVFFYFLGSLFPSPPKSSQAYIGNDGKWDILSIPDLRISEYAPDLKIALHKQNEWENGAYYRNTIELAQLKKQAYLLREQLIQEQKIERWKAGNPVTKENPL